MIRQRQQLHYSDGCSCNSGPPGGAGAFLQPRNVPQPSQGETVDSQGWRRIMLVMPRAMRGAQSWAHAAQHSAQQMSRPAAYEQRGTRDWRGNSDLRLRPPQAGASYPRRYGIHLFVLATDGLHTRTCCRENVKSGMLAKARRSVVRPLAPVNGQPYSSSSRTSTEDLVGQ